MTCASQSGFLTFDGIMTLTFLDRIEHGLSGA